METHVAVSEISAKWRYPVPVARTIPSRGNATDPAPGNPEAQPTMTKSSRWYPEKIYAGEFGGEHDDVSVGFLFSENNALHSKPRSSLQIAELIETE